MKKIASRSKNIATMIKRTQANKVRNIEHTLHTAPQKYKQVLLERLKTWKEV